MLSDTRAYSFRPDFSYRNSTKKCKLRKLKLLFYKMLRSRAFRNVPLGKKCINKFKFHISVFLSLLTLKEEFLNTKPRLVASESLVSLRKWKRHMKTGHRMAKHTPTSHRSDLIVSLLSANSTSVLRRSRFGTLSSKTRKVFPNF